MKGIKLTQQMTAIVFQEGKDPEIYIPENMSEDDIAPQSVIEAVMALYFLTSNNPNVEKMRDQVMDLILKDAKKVEGGENA